ncbi:MAG TPA: 30S ribosomal protein S15 [Phycisphaerales bacterium]|nr:30S ribosomal protein S15 [Phycisphaerales bacterium]
MALLAEERKSIASKHRRHDTDSGSPEVQVAMLTAKIAAVADHLKGNDKDHHSRRGLLLMVGKRNRLLKYLARTNPAGYQGLITKLGLRK